MALKGNIFEAKTLDELKAMGKLADVRVPLKKAAAEHNIKAPTNGWDRTWESLQNLLKLVPELAGESEVAVDVWDDPYFKSREAKVIYYLLHVSGEERTNFLGITKKMYSDKALARQWMLEKMKLVHPDNCSHPDAAKAADAVSRIYDNMIS